MVSIPSLRRYRKIRPTIRPNTAEATEVGAAAASSNRTTERKNYQTLGAGISAAGNQRIKKRPRNSFHHLG
jgi:hypothetical protein